MYVEINAIERNHTWELVDLERNYAYRREMDI